MSTYPKLLEGICKSEKLTDILVPGYIATYDKYKIPEFAHMHAQVFFQFEKTLLHFQSTEQHSIIKSEVVDSIFFDFEIDEEQGETPAIASLYELIGKGSSYLINNFTIFYKDESSLNSGRFSAIEFTIEWYELSVFLDPEYISGINLGTQQQKEMYISSHKQLKSYRLKIIQLQIKM